MLIRVDWLTSTAQRGESCSLFKMICANEHMEVTSSQSNCLDQDLLTNDLKVAGTCPGECESVTVQILTVKLQSSGD